jgi:hypothetical protein
MIERSDTLDGYLSLRWNMDRSPTFPDTGSSLKQTGRGDEDTEERQVEEVAGRETEAEIRYQVSCLDAMSSS